MKKDLRSQPGFTFSFFITGIILSLFLTSCYVYVPNVINAPLLSNKGEVQANLNIGESGFDPQISAAVSDYVGVMVNGSFRFNNNNSTTGEIHNFVEAGAGYYTKFENIGRFEIYGGAGVGNLTANNANFWTSTEPEIHVKTFRLFLQPDIGVKTNYFEASFAPRLVLLNLDMGRENSTNFFIEPAITVKGGAKNIKIVFQAGCSIPTGMYYDNFYDPLIMSVRIQGTFGRKTEKAKPTVNQ